MKESTWFIYILRCSDNSLYTGITTDINRRLHEHNHTADGAKYTRSRRPLTVVYYEKTTSRSLAASREYKIKNLTRLKKEDLIRTSNQVSLTI